MPRQPGQQSPSGAPEHAASERGMPVAKAATDNRMALQTQQQAPRSHYNGSVAARRGRAAGNLTTKAEPPPGVNDPHIRPSDDGAPEHSNHADRFLSNGRCENTKNTLTWRLYMDTAGSIKDNEKRPQETTSRSHFSIKSCGS